MQVLREFYSVSRKASFPLPAVDAVEAVRYLAAFSPVPEDAAMVLGAVRRSTEISFRDALIVEAAISARGSYLHRGSARRRDRGGYADREPVPVRLLKRSTRIRQPDFPQAIVELFQESRELPPLIFEGEPANGFIALFA